VQPNIDRDPRILGGEPKIRGTRLSVRTIVVAFQGWGDVDRLLDAYPELARRDVEEALAYYAAHTAEIDSYIARDRAED
jgi:uncharacterized protein (DUF433 family)